jgi:hypothetical protein
MRSVPFVVGLDFEVCPIAGREPELFKGGTAEATLFSA